MPSSCRMLIYRDLTSIVKRIISEGRLWLRVGIYFQEFCGVFEKRGDVTNQGFKNFDNLTVRPSQPEMIGSSRDARFVNLG